MVTIGGYYIRNKPWNVAILADILENRDPVALARAAGAIQGLACFIIGLPADFIFITNEMHESYFSAVDVANTVSRVAQVINYWGRA
jgi:ABC-type thiamin/hydroxymethylpyrimidine transport system permease subunit